ncbi:uncharacterized protein [Venturia canescens]|uniref:uncharacterized protein n=1 Tax=Venturia canescens TaxID=32260 RepID=UPI001C9CEE33|nr:uncharacterized protein LOC122415946 [Venturia canescens]
MEKRNCAAILLLVFGIIGVYSYPQNSNTATNDAVPDVSGLDSYAEGDRVSCVLSDDKTPYGSLPRVPYRVNGKSKRSAGGNKNADDNLKKLRNYIKRAGVKTNVLPNESPQEIERRQLANDLDRITRQLMELLHLDYDTAFDHAVRRNPHLSNRLLELYGRNLVRQ